MYYFRPSKTEQNKTNNNKKKTTKKPEFTVSSSAARGQIREEDGDDRAEGESKQEQGSGHFECKSLGLRTGLNTV